MILLYNKYNFDNITNSSNILQFTQAVSNDILGGSWLGIIILMIVFGVFFFAIKNQGNHTSSSFAVACWITALCAMLLKPMNLISEEIWWMTLMLIPISLFVLWVAGRES